MIVTQNALQYAPAVPFFGLCERRKHWPCGTLRASGKLRRTNLVMSRSLLENGLTFPQIPLLNAPNQTCDCSGTNDTGESGSSYICRDPRLGPTLLPKTFPLLSFVSDYDRFGGQTPGDFLKHWTDEDGSYVYPPQNGFQLNDAGQPILGNMTMPNGTKVDRFGSEYGMAIPQPRLLAS